MHQGIAAAAAAAVALLASCSSGSTETPAAVASPGPATTAATTPAATRATAAKPARLGLCPANPPRNGDLSDQGEQVGRVGASSSTMLDANGDRLYCLAVTKVERASNGVIVTVLLVNQAGKPVDLDGENAPGLPVLTYGEDGTKAELVSSFSEGERGSSYFDGVVGPARRRTAEYAFVAPSGRQQVSVSLLGFSWDGTVS